ncbi:MAG TPA: putative LPS assembly protein LptD [Vicinamibacterales bacterium]|nr:putative LPS assembly protein LptD [Vicinamibacterales bacterium]
MTPRLFVCTALLAALHAAAASAQVPGYNSKQFRIEQVNGDHWRFTGQVELENDEVKGQKFYANVVDLYTDSHRLEASGNVLYETATSRIAAERVIFNTRSGTGTFYTASGLATIGERADKSMFGALEPDVYFYGETLEKTAEDKYKVTKGGFTTCVQPTPRWEMVAGSITINVGDYAILRNAVMRIKDVPILYLPIVYYPIQDDDRATGFLLPSYGRSTYQGQSVSNAFFWAISRNQDLSLLHDWYTARGQGYGTEYRWVATPTSGGNLRAYRLSQKAATVNGIPLPAQKSFLVNGAVNQNLPFNLTGRALVDYSSSFQVNQLYSRDIYNATQSVSRITGSVTGSWNFLNASLTGNRQQQFFGATQSIITGSMPSLTAAVSSRRLGRLPLFFAVQSEASRPIYVQKNGSNEIDSSMSKLDITPTLRAPLSKLPFLNVNLNMSYRVTRYSESLESGRQVEVPYLRRYADMRADFVGPVFSKVYTPNNFLADRLKHVIEPAFSVQRVTAIDGEDRVVRLGSSYDFVVGGVTRMTYGLTNRVLVRKASKNPAASTLASAPRELLTASVTQSYYTDQRASRFDPTYNSTYVDNGSARPASNYSPVALQVRTQPLTALGASARAEYDYATRKMLSLSTSGDYGVPAARVALSWSRSLSSFFPTNSINGSTHLSVLGGRLGGDYSLNWDLQRDVVLQQRVMAFYNAQCCGVVVEYSQFNPYVGSALPTDRRFNIGFTLAGVGTFSNFFGNFGGRSY